jgi:hypothetical protein
MFIYNRSHHKNAILQVLGISDIEETEGEFLREGNGYYVLEDPVFGMWLGIG